MLLLWPSVRSSSKQPFRHIVLSLVGHRQPLSLSTVVFFREIVNKFLKISARKKQDKTIIENLPHDKEASKSQIKDLSLLGITQQPQRW